MSKVIYSSQVVVDTHLIDCSIWTTKVVGIMVVKCHIFECTERWAGILRHGYGGRGRTAGGVDDGTADGCYVNRPAVEHARRSQHHRNTVRRIDGYRLGGMVQRSDALPELGTMRQTIA